MINQFLRIADRQCCYVKKDEFRLESSGERDCVRQSVVAVFRKSVGHRIVFTRQ